MAGNRPTQWPLLFDLTIDILRQFETANGLVPEWSFGGGTALMLRIDHRESHDVDIFIADPQILPYLNPATQGYTLSRQPDDYAGDGTTALKLVYQGVGEIDFISCASILGDPTEQRDVRGQEVALETAAEIVAKKVFFRGGNFQPRDMFDLAAVEEHYGRDYVIRALRECGEDRCATALATVTRANPEFVQSIISQLMYRETSEHLVERAQSVSRDVLEEALIRSRDRRGAGRSPDEA